MSYVQSATAEAAEAVARSRQSVADPASATAESDLNFASLFAMTRESAFLDTLLSRQGEAYAARHTRQRQTEETFDADKQQETSRRASREARSETSTRSERIKAARQEQAAEANAPDETKQQTTEETRGHRADRAANERHAQQRETSESETQKVQTPNEAECASESVVDSAASQQIGDPGSSQTLASQSDTLQPLGTGSMTSSSGGGSTHVVEMNVPATATPQSSAAQAIPSAEPMPMSIPSTAGKGQSDANAQQNSNGVATAAKAGNASPNSVASNNEFQSLLQQVGRERAAVVRQAVAASAKPLSEESVRLTKTEAIEQLARIVRTGLGGKTSSMTLRLDPPELGQLRVDIRMQDQNVVLRFQADTQTARDLLENRLPELRHALDQHGIRLDRVEVDIRPPAMPDQQGRDAESQSQQHNLPQGGEPGFGQTPEQQGGQNGSQESDSSTGLGAETWTGSDASALSGLKVNEADASAEKGVDLIV